MGKMIMNGVSYGINANSTIYGAFIDTTNVLKPRTTYSGSFSYTATQDCAVVVEVANATSNSASIFIDGALVGSIYGGNSVNQLTDTYYIKRGQTISGTTGVSGAAVGYSVYGLLYNAGETTNTVIPNPQAVPRDTLDSISIGGMVYEIEGGGGGSDVVVDPTITSGTKIADITVDGDTSSLYAPEVSLTYAEYMALTEQEKNNGTTYYITDMDAGKVNIFAPIIYSQQEREIGVWIDNKPLYQKTLVYNNITKGRVDNLPHNISNIDRIVYNDWVFVNSQNHQSVTGFENTSNNYWAAIFSIDDIGISYRIGTDWYVDTLIVNIKYTKTTDVAGSGLYNSLGVPTVHYSQGESVIGTWVDGKTLYRYYGDLDKSIGTSWVQLPELNTLNIATCIKVVIFAIDYAPAFDLQYDSSSTPNEIIRARNAVFAAKHILLEYTKTS